MSGLIDTLVTWWPRLWEGLLITLQLSVGGAVLAFVVAIVLGLASISKVAVLRGISRVIVEFFRGTSLVVQLFWFFYVMPQFGIELGAATCAILALGLNYGAYGAEVVRGSLNAVPEGQWEVTTALSMPWAVQMRRVIWPQAWALMLPGMNNLMVMLVKGTSLALLVTLQDLTFVTDDMRRSAGTFVAFGIALLLYYLVALAFSTALRWLERRAQRRLGLRPTRAKTTKDVAEAVA